MPALGVRVLRLLRRLTGPTMRLGEIVLFGVLPVLLVLIALREHGLGWDFRAYYSGAQSRLVIKAPHSTPISGTLRKS